MTEQQQKPVFSTITGWLVSGFGLYRQTLLASSLYALLFIVVGSPIYAVLLSKGLSLVFYVLGAGFLLVAPVLSSGYYSIFAQLKKGEAVTTGGGFIGLRAVPAAVWIIGLITAALYLIWVTDALILYSFYFSTEPVPISAMLENPTVGSDVKTFTAYSALLGFILALIVFCITAFSIPRAFYDQAGFADSIVFSIKSIGRYFRLMMAWAAVIALFLLVGGVLLPPLLIVLLPVLTYANGTAYFELLAPESGT